MSKPAIKLATSNDKTHQDDARLAAAYKDLESELCEALHMTIIVADRVADTFESPPSERGGPISPVKLVPPH